MFKAIIFLACFAAIRPDTRSSSFGCSLDLDGCFCFQGYLSCRDRTSFPDKFPLEVEHITFDNFNFTKIPKDAFRGLNKIRSFKAYTGTIQTIESFAFDGIETLDTIYMSNVATVEIQSRAFSNLRNISLTIILSSVDTIRSYAFYNIHTAQELVLSTLNITSIESHAFENLSEIHNLQLRRCNIVTMAPRSFHNISSVQLFGFYNNKMDVFGCDSVDKVMTNMANPDDIFFYNNEAKCGCSLGWVLDNPVMKNFFYSNLCHLPNTHIDVTFQGLTLEILNCTKEDTNCPADETPEPPIGLELTTDSITTHIMTSTDKTEVTSLSTGTPWPLSGDIKGTDHKIGSPGSPSTESTSFTGSRISLSETAVSSHPGSRSTVPFDATSLSHTETSGTSRDTSALNSNFPTSPANIRYPETSLMPNDTSTIYSKSPTSIPALRSTITEMTSPAPTKGHQNGRSTNGASKIIYSSALLILTFVSFTRLY